MIRDPLRWRTLVFVVLLAGIALCGAVEALAKERRVAFILSTSPIAEMAGRDPAHPGLRAFIDELRALGYAEGRTEVIAINVTGLTVEGGPQIDAKRLQILEQVMPAARRIDYLGTRRSWQSAYALAARGAAQSLGMELLHVEHTPTDYAAAFARMERERPDPSYGVNALSLFRRSAHYVDKILKGASPADLPVEQPSTYDLVIDLKAAASLGLSIPPAMLLQASELIQ